MRFPRRIACSGTSPAAGRWDEAREVYRWYTPLLHLDTHVKLVQYIKLAQQECGLGSELRARPAAAAGGRGARAGAGDHPPRDRDSPQEEPQFATIMNRSG